MNGIVLSIPLILLGGVFAWIGLYFWREGRDLRDAGIEARAIVVRKFRKEGDPFLFGIENYFVVARFSDRRGIDRNVDVRVPSRQWHWIQEGTIQPIIFLPNNPNRARIITHTGQVAVGSALVFAGVVGVLMTVGGVFLGVTSFQAPARIMGVNRGTAIPPRSRFDKSGVLPGSMIVSPQHDLVAVLDGDGNNLSIHEVFSGKRLSSIKGNSWRLLTWSPDGSRLAVAEGAKEIVLSSTLLPLPAEAYSWNPRTPPVGKCSDIPPIWDSARQQAAVPCENNLMILVASSARLLTGHTDRVVGAAWSPSGNLVASVSEDNYVRIWDPTSMTCLMVSEDYPYPRSVFFTSERTVVVVDAALRQYTIRIPD